MYIVFNFHLYSFFRYYTEIVRFWPVAQEMFFFFFFFWGGGGGGGLIRSYHVLFPLGTHVLDCLNWITGWIFWLDSFDHCFILNQGM